MKARVLIPAALVLSGLFAGATLTGCGAVRGGRTIVKFDQGTRPVMTEVRASGNYALFSLRDYNPRMTVHLKEGDPIGFKASETGQVTAVAGGQEFPLEADQTYYWKRMD